MATTNWSTLHIFGYGETQLIGSNPDKKVSSATLTTLQAVIDNIYSFKPAESEATEEYHAINIFFDLFADWQTKQPSVNGWRVEYSELNQELVDALVAEIISQPSI
jgi:thioesterase domain-containing protein